MNCRCLSVNSQLEYDFTSSTIYPQAVLIEDINQDNKNEIVIGTTSGEILVYKGSLATPWLKNSKPIGSITCIAFDSLTDTKQKYLIVTDALGFIYFYNINYTWLRKRYASDLTCTKSNPNDWKLDLTVVYQKKLLINPKYMLVDDLYNNGSKKLIIGYSDRFIRVYGWINGTLSQVSNQNTNYSFQEIGNIVLEHSYEFSNQICSINIQKFDENSGKRLIVTLPGKCALISKEVPLVEKGVLSAFEEFITLSDWDGTKSNELDRSIVPTFLLTDVKFDNSKNHAFLITSNGEVYFLNLDLPITKTVKAPIWHRNLNTMIIHYYKHQTNKDDELLLASVEGHIFHMNCHGEFICYDLGEPIKSIYFGFFPISEQFNLNLIESGSEIDLTQSSHPAFDYAIDSSPLGTPRLDETNSLCFVYFSSISNKIVLLQADTILANCKSKASSITAMKCENVFSRKSKLGASIEKLSESFEVDNQQNLNKILRKILYPSG